MNIFCNHNRGRKASKHEAAHAVVANRLGAIAVQIESGFGTVSPYTRYTMPGEAAMTSLDRARHELAISYAGHLMTHGKLPEKIGEYKETLQHWGNIYQETGVDNKQQEIESAARVALSIIREDNVVILRVARKLRRNHMTLTTQHLHQLMREPATRLKSR